MKLIINQALRRFNPKFLREFKCLRIEFVLVCIIYIYIKSNSDNIQRVGPEYIKDEACIKRLSCYEEKWFTNLRYYIVKKVSLILVKKEYIEMSIKKSAAISVYRENKFAFLF